MSPDYTVRDLVSGPFIACPKCGAQEFGVYGIHPNVFDRRCRACWHGATYWLPDLSRKVIYIDQFAISDMMKALNSEHPRHKQAADNPFWVRLFSRLDTLIKKQLIICPYSDVHHHESLVTRHYEALKLMYEHLSHGIHFDSIEAILSRQLDAALQAWLQGNTPKYELDPARVTSGGINDWQERFIISVDMAYPQAMTRSIERFRDEIHAKIRDLFDTLLRSAERREFTQWLAHEHRAGGRAVLEAADEWYRRIDDMRHGRVRPAMETLYNSQGWKHYQQIHDGIEQWTPEDQVDRKVAEFLMSEAYRSYPANRISALVWAAIDQAASNGQREPPNAGMSNDIQVLTLMPFCDAMFIDNGCRGLWDKVPRRFRTDYKTQLFSYNTREQFMTYLDEIERQADHAVLEAVNQVYGERTPFLGMYEYHRRRREREAVDPM
jgi:hypothetical protein